MQYRLRKYYFIKSSIGDNLIYDLERTYVIPVDKSISSEQIEKYNDYNDLRQWLLSNDLLTTAEFKLPTETRNPKIPVLSDLSIDMSGSCNMGCVYCFEKDINSRLGKIDEVTAMKAVDFFFSKNTAAKKVALHFGSGEPLLQFKTLKKIVTRAYEHSQQNNQEVSFDLTTNATLITDEIATYFSRHPFNIRVSFDGPEDIHNRFRPMINNTPSYNKVLKGLEILLKVIPDKVTVNSVLSRGTRLVTLWNWANEIGIKHFHVIKVGTYSHNESHLVEEDLDDFQEDLDLVCQDILKSLKSSKPFIDYQPISKIIRRLMIPQPITRFCGVAGSYLGVSSKGKVYPCFRHIGVEQYHLGDIWNGIDDSKRKSFLANEAADVDTRPICNSCWARYLCGGGCYADSTVYGDSPGLPKTDHCPFWRKEIEVAIKFYNELLNENPEFIMQLFGDTLESAESSLSDMRVFKKQNCS